MKSLILVKIDTNWADEMDVGSFAVMETSVWKEHENKIKKIFKMLGQRSLRVGIGSNQEMYYDSLKEYKKSYNAVKITSEKAKFLCKEFGIKVNDSKKKNFDSYSSFGNWILLEPWHMDEMLFDEKGNPLKELNYYD